MIRLERPVELFTAVLLGAVATLGRTFFPTQPSGAWTLRIFFGVFALIFVIRALRPAPTGPRRLVSKVVDVLGVLVLLLFLGMLGGHGLVLLFIINKPLLFAVVIGVLVTALTTAWFVYREVIPVIVLRVVLTVLVFGVATSYAPMCMLMWARPPLETCHRVAEHPAVVRLTPDAFVTQRSFPYEMAYMPSVQRVAASFKSSGNLVIGLWDDPEANRLVVVDVSNRQKPVMAALTLEGAPIPGFMATSRSGDMVVVNRLGYHRNLLDYVYISGFPTLRLDKRLDTVSQPHAMQLVDGERLMMATMNREVFILDFHTGEVRERSIIRTSFATPGFTITDMAVSPDGRLGFASMLGTDVVRIDPSRGALGVRARPVGFGAGEILHDPVEPQLYETDFFQDEVRVIDSRTLHVVRETALDFAPRPVAVAPSRDLLFVGNWFDGVVHFLRRSNSEPLDIAIPVGPYLRELAVDDARGMLFAASKCGLYLIDLDAIGSP